MSKKKGYQKGKGSRGHYPRHDTYRSQPKKPRYTQDGTDHTPSSTRPPQKGKGKGKCKPRTSQGSATPAPTVSVMGTLPESVVSVLGTKTPKINVPLKPRMSPRYMTMNLPYS